MMMYSDMTKDALRAELSALKEAFESIKAEGLCLNMARGKPGKEQLDLHEPLLTAIRESADCMDGGVDVRNYGELMGLPSARAYFADLLGVAPENVFAGGSASLQLMFDLLMRAYIWGLKDSPRPWCKEKEIKWLCPAPGYDRHFLISEKLGMQMITVPMTENGPDMDIVEKYAADPAVKGIWCVPKYSNPDGIIYSNETVARFVHMKTAAPDFTVMWDNAYCVHEFSGGYVPFPSILAEAEKAGTADRFYEFASTSKITFSGAGISCMACSRENMDFQQKYLTVQIISFDKMNQLRHVRYLKDKAHTLTLMQKQAELLAPKFALVAETLSKELCEVKDLCFWRDPKGGYFVSFYSMPGTAKRVIALAQEAGVTLTGAGAAYPCHIDPDDSNIRIAPSYPAMDELRKAMQIFCLAVKIAAAEKLLGKK